MGNDWKKPQEVERVWKLLWRCLGNTQDHSANNKKQGKISKTKNSNYYHFVVDKVFRIMYISFNKKQ